MNLPDSSKIEIAYTKLSQEEFDVMNKINIDATCERIGKLMRLTPEQITATALYVTYTILGVYSEKELREALETEEMSQMQVTEVFSQIIDLILNPYLEEVAQLKALAEDEGALEHTDADIEIIDEAIPEKLITPDEEKEIATTERTLLASDGVIVEDAQTTTEIPAQLPTESRDQILEDIENPQKSEGVVLDVASPIVQPTHATSIPIRSIPTIFETGPMGSSPSPISPTFSKGEWPKAEGASLSSPSVPVAVTGTPPLTQGKEIRTEAKTPHEAPEGLPVEPDEPTAPVVNTIPITTTPPVIEKKRIENPGPIAINIPTPVLEKTIPIVTAVEPVPVVVTKEATLPQEVPTTPSVPKEPVFKDIPKVTIVDVGSLAPTQAPAGNPLEQPELLKAAQEHLRQLARERQKGFIAQKMTTTFSLPKTETVVGVTPKAQTDPYKETL